MVLSHTHGSKTLLNGLKRNLHDRNLPLLCEAVVELFAKDLVLQSIDVFLEEYCNYYLTFNAHTIVTLSNLLKIVHQQIQQKSVSKRLLCNVRMIRVAVTQLFVMLYCIPRTELQIKYKLNKNESKCIMAQTDHIPDMFHMVLRDKQSTNIQRWYRDRVSDYLEIKSQEMFKVWSRLCYTLVVKNDPTVINGILSLIHNETGFHPSIVLHSTRTQTSEEVEFIRSATDLNVLPTYVVLLLFTCVSLCKTPERLHVVHPLLFMYLTHYKKGSENKRYNLLLHAFVIACMDSIEESIVHVNQHFKPVILECGLKIAYLFKAKEQEQNKLRDCNDVSLDKPIDRELYEKALFSTPTIDWSKKQKARELMEDTHHRSKLALPRLVKIESSSIMDNKIHSKKNVHIVKTVK
jgi:hypothetical protein